MHEAMFSPVFLIESMLRATETLLSPISSSRSEFISRLFAECRTLLRVSSSVELAFRVMLRLRVRSSAV